MKNKGKKRRALSMLLAVLLSIALLPAGALAQDLPENDPKTDESRLADQQSEELIEVDVQDEEILQAYGAQDTDVSAEAEEEALTEEEAAYDAEPAAEEAALQAAADGEDEEIPIEDVDPIDPGPVSKSFKLKGYQLQFKSAVVQTPPAVLDNAIVNRPWIKAAKTSITLNWGLAKNMDFVDGVIIMRKTGKEKVYKELARVKFKTFENGVAVVSPKTSYTDKTAKKKNTPYSYIVISYLDEDDYIYISNPSEWAAGQTTASKLKNATTAKINKTSASLQFRDTVKLTLKYSKPKTIYDSKTFRWYSDNPAVAKVGKTSGVVTAVAPGSTVIRGRMPSGAEKTCKVSVVGAFRPAAPKIAVDVASNNSISLYWTASKYATSYDLYKSDDGLHWDDPIRVKGTSKKVTGLKKGQRYTFYVIARNDNGPYTAESKNSNVINQKAVIKRRPTKVTGFPTSKKLTSGTTFKVTIKVTSPEARKASLQMKKGKKWVTKKKVTLPKGTGTSSLKITFPNDWWDGTTYWKLVIPKSNTAEDYTSKTLTITAKRKYQNPSGYVQISNSISKHGYSYYTSPVLVNSTTTRSGHVEALIKTATKYKGCAYRESHSGSPSGGVDASGLVIQACYGAGVDLWPVSPATRPYNCVPAIMNAKLQKVSFSVPDEEYGNYVGLNRGDLVFFNLPNGVTGHVAIYLGWGKIIHASPVSGKVEVTTIKRLTDPDGSYNYTVLTSGRRIFVY